MWLSTTSKAVDYKQSLKCSGKSSMLERETEIRGLDGPAWTQLVQNSVGTGNYTERSRKRFCGNQAS